MSPRLALYRDGQDLGGAFFEARIEVENLGGGFARDIVIVTSWVEARVDAPVLRPKDRRSVARVRITSQEWQERRGTENANARGRTGCQESH